MIVARSRGDGAAANYEIGAVTVALQRPRAGDDSWAGLIPFTDGCRPMVRRAQPGYVAAPASLLALVKCR